MSEVALSAVRCQGGWEREAMQPFELLDDESAQVYQGRTCPACQRAFAQSEVVTVVPIGPGDDQDDQRRARESRWYSAAAVVAHAACAGLDVDARVMNSHDPQAECGSPDDREASNG
jgi:hypothetical protein